MTSMLRRRTVPFGLAGALLLAAASGCAEEGDGGEAGAASSGAPATTSAVEETPATTDELAEGLLPADAFGPDADVVTVDLRQLATSGSTLPEGATVTPAECSLDLGAVQLTEEDFGAVVAQTAQTQTAITVQVLAEDDQIEAGSAAGFDELLDRCAHIDITIPDGSTGAADIREMEVPDVGDVSEGVAITITSNASDGSVVTITSLLGVAVEGQRMLFLQQAAPDGAPLDEAAFGDLFEQAYEAQRDV